MPAGKDLLTLARKHVGEKYVLGAQAPKDAADYKGPWDCAEFASWLVYQVSQKLYGCIDDHAAPSVADAFSGAWASDAERLGKKVSVEEAANTLGAFVVRRPNEAGIRIGHVVLSDGAGGTVEAHSTKTGVIKSQLAGRTWSFGVLVPGIDVTPGATPAPELPPVEGVLQLTTPPTTGSDVRTVQRMLKAAGFNPGGIDGVYGQRTMQAVATFQQAKGLVPDGEVGPVTRKALEKAAGG
jgi:hypothetical protein